MAEFDLDKMAKRVAEEALDEFTYKDKTLREWIGIIAAQDLLAIEELEKIKDRLEIAMWYNRRDKEYCIDLINKRISELKGEYNNE